MDFISVWYGLEMIDQKHRDFLSIFRAQYKKVGYIYCKAFNYEKVYFNSYGYNHIIRKQRKFRIKKEQARRANLLPKAIEILISSAGSSGNTTNSEVKFWSFKKDRITVIVRQLRNGTKHFFSVF